MKPHRPLRVGIAGWNIPKTYIEDFAKEGSHLERYTARFSAVEINSSFYRTHRPSTYERWAESVPPEFKFSAKIPRDITHRRKLVDVDALLTEFISQVTHLGCKLGPLLVQLPPSLHYDQKVAAAFFKKFRAIFDGQIVCEPRHKTWFAQSSNELLSDFAVARVAADPAIVPHAIDPGGISNLIYWRLHGSPKIYYSSYSSEFLLEFSRRINSQQNAVEQWCIFDNTALGEATNNAFQLDFLVD